MAEVSMDVPYVPPDDDRSRAVEALSEMARNVYRVPRAACISVIPTPQTGHRQRMRVVWSWDDGPHHERGAWAAIFDALQKSRPDPQVSFDAAVLLKDLADDGWVLRWAENLPEGGALPPERRHGA